MSMIEISLKNIVETTNFDNLSHLEKEHGFIEATKHSNFFRKGKKKQWKDILTSKQINEIENCFKDSMKKYNYL